MRVLYDASVLGTVWGTSGSRAGVFRVADTLGRLLLGRSDCEVAFGAAHSAWALYNLVAYSHTQEDLRTARFGCRAPFDRSIPLRHALAELEQRENPALPDRLRRSLLYRRVKQVENGAGEADYCDYDRFEVYHSPFFPLPQRDVTGGASGPQRFLTVHDLVAIRFPQYFARLPDQKDVVPAAIRSIGPEDWVFTVSECTKRDLCEYRPDLDPDRVTVVYWGASGLFYRHPDEPEARRIRGAYGIPDAPYMLSLATLEPRKNIEHVIRSFAAWVQQERVAEVNLVLVGEKGWGYEEILAEVNRLGNLSDRIIITGRVEDADLAAVYTGALGFTYLSLYEGFGLPPLEAMQCGVPVITSDRSSLPEVVGDAGVQLAPDDEEGLCSAFGRLWRDEEWRARLSRQSTERAKRFSWDRCVSETITAYRRALKSRHRRHRRSAIMHILIPAGGRGNRLRPLTDHCPKPLLPLGEQPILTRILGGIPADLPVTVLITPELEEDFLRWRQGVEGARPVTLYVEQKRAPGTGGPVSAISDCVRDLNIRDDTVTLMGDSIPTFSITTFLKGVAPHIPRLVAYRLADHEDARRFGVVSIDESGKVASFEEKPESPRSRWVFTGCLYIPRGLLGLVGDLAASCSQVGHLVSGLMASGHEVEVYQTEGDWQDIGTLESFMDAHRTLLQAAARRGLEEAGNKLRGTVYVHPFARVRNSVLENCVVFSGARISGCRIRRSIITEHAEIHEREVEGQLVTEQAEYGLELVETLEGALMEHRR